MTKQSIEGIDVRVYRSEVKQETYAYLPADADFDDLPEAFKAHFGAAVEFYAFHLHAEKKLAQAQAHQVLAAISEQGFYLQLPPPKQPARAPSE